MRFGCMRNDYECSCLTGPRPTASVCTPVKSLGGNATILVACSHEFFTHPAARPLTCTRLQRLQARLSVLPLDLTHTHQKKRGTPGCGPGAPRQFASAGA